MKRIGKILIFALLLCRMEAFSESYLLAGEFYLPDNRIDLEFDEAGAIAFMQITDYPGDNYMTREGLDIVDEASQAHDRYILRREVVQMLSPDTWKVEGHNTFPALIQLAPSSIKLTLGNEVYSISRPGNYLVEVRPILADGSPDPTRRFAYGLARNKAPGTGFLGIVDRSYEPPDVASASRKSDWLAITYPRKFTMGGNSLEAKTYCLTGSDADSAQFEFIYSIAISGNRDIDLGNYLILMSRRADNPGLFIHPVLLTLLYFDALVR